MPNDIRGHYESKPNQCYTRFDEKPFTCQRDKEDKKGFQIPHCYRSFSTDIMAAKGLISSAFCKHLGLAWDGAPETSLIKLYIDST